MKDRLYFDILGHAATSVISSECTGLRGRRVEVVLPFPGVLLLTLDSSRGHAFAVEGDATWKAEPVEDTPCAQFCSLELKEGNAHALITVTELSESAPPLIIEVSAGSAASVTLADGSRDAPGVLLVSGPIAQIANMFAHTPESGARAAA